MLLKTKLFFLRKCSLCSYLNNEQPPKIFLAFLWAHLLNENSSNLIFLYCCVNVLYITAFVFSPALSLFFTHWHLLNMFCFHDAKEGVFYLWRGQKEKKKDTGKGGERGERRGKDRPWQKVHLLENWPHPRACEQHAPLTKVQRAEELTLALPAGWCLWS